MNILFRLKTMMNDISKQEVLDILSKNVDDSIISFDQFPKANQFKDLTEAVELFINHIKKGSRILFIHDSDADGIGTFMISKIYFEKYFPGLNIEIVITDRSKGYGFQPLYVQERLNTLFQPNLIITADNGITSHEGCQLARDNNIDVIITDHHQVDMFKGKPNANYIIDPHQEDCFFPFPDINGTLVYWYFINEFHQKMGGEGNLYYEFLPELAMTVVSDVMPIKNINRFIVKDALQKFSTHHRQWTKTFFTSLDKNDVTIEDFGFNLVPCINVAARMANAEDAAIFMTQEFSKGSLEWFSYLKELNDTRKARQEKLIKTIKSNYQSWLDASFIIIPGEDFQKGILGPVAGRLAEEFKKPTIVLSKSRDGKTYSGSGRSVGEVDLLDLLKNNPFVIQDKTGGHKAACGVSFPVENLNDFWYRLQEDTNKVPLEKYNEKSKGSYGYLDLDDITFDFFNKIEKFQPFGKDFERPSFTSTGLLTSARKMGKDSNHYNLEIQSNKGVKFRSIWFFFSKELKRNNIVEFTYNIMLDTFNKDNPQLCLHIKSIQIKEKND